MWHFFQMFLAFGLIYSLKKPHSDHPYGFDKARLKSKFCNIENKSYTAKKITFWLWNALIGKNLNSFDKSFRSKFTIIFFKKSWHTGIKFTWKRRESFYEIAKESSHLSLKSWFTNNYLPHLSHSLWSFVASNKAVRRSTFDQISHAQ